MSEICASCLDFDINKIVKSNDYLAPKWLDEKDHVRDFISKNNRFNNRHPQSFNVKMRLNVGKQHWGKKILYWATTEKKAGNLHINDARTAYGTFTHSGIATIQKSGEVLLKVACPQIYHTTAANKYKPQSYYRHLHFVFSNERKDKWMDQIYTKIIVCKFDLKKSLKMLKGGEFVFINALPCEYYGKDHIPNSYNLTPGQVKQMTQNQLFGWFEEIIRVHYPKVHVAVKSKKINIHEIPVITYCAHDKCNASELLLEELMKKGMINANEYSGGMKEYRKKF